MKDKKEYYLILGILVFIVLSLVFIATIGDLSLVLLYPFFLLFPLGILWMIKYWHQQERDVQYIPKEIILKIVILIIEVFFYFGFNFHSFLSLGFNIACYLIMSFTIFSIIYDVLLYHKLSQKKP